MPAYVRECEYCGEKFVAKRRDARYCSANHVLRAHRDRERVKRHTIDGLSSGEQILLAQLERSAPKTADRIKNLIAKRGVTEAKRLLPYLAGVLAETGKLDDLLASDGGD